MKMGLGILGAILLLTSCETTKNRVSLYSEDHIAYGEWKRTSDCCSADGTRFAIASGGEHASRIGAEILKSGGNLVDAAVATAFAIAVERPHSAGLGGGAFMTLHLAGSPAKDLFIDFRETAPRKATRDMYLDANKNVVAGLSTDGALSIGTPGFVAGLYDIHQRYGKLPWKVLVQPAQKLAETGFQVYPTLQSAISENAERIKDTYTRSILLPKGKVPEIGAQFVQKDLARTLKLISEKGKQVFYEGEIASKISAHVLKHGGLLDTEDLKEYRPVSRMPITGSWHGYSFVTAPPPSAGGVLFVEMFNVLSQLSLDSELRDPTDYVHLLSQVMKQAYADRSQYIGDPEFSRTGYERLLRTDYAIQIKDRLDPNKNVSSAEISPLSPIPTDHGTAHFSLIDSEGNAVAGTMTINDSFGSGMAVPGTGVFLNNEMDDFSAKPGQQNIYGLTGSTANSIAPKKRPVSSMTPTILMKNGKPMFVVGAAGGSRIISSVFETILNYTHLYQGDVKKAVFAPRFHHQWIPDQLDLEEGFAASLRTSLAAKGHKITEWPFRSNVEAVGYSTTGKLTAAFDPRDYGGAVAE